MACERRKRTGSCGHPQCPFPNHSGYECVDIAGKYCEVGENCNDQCEYSWPSEKLEEANAAFDGFEG